MKEIKDEILLEKLRQNPNKQRIQNLQQIVDKNTLSLNEFSNLGMFMSRDSYLTNVNKSAKLKDNCTDVVYYLYNFVVQVIDSSLYFIELQDAKESDEMNTIVETSHLRVVEKIMFNELL